MKRLVFLLSFLVIPLAFGQSLKRRDLILWDLKITGNQRIPENTIREAIASTESTHLPKWLAFLDGGRKPFYASIFREDLKRILHLYRRSGHYQAKIVRSDFNRCEAEGDREKICAEIEIDEGPATPLVGVSANVEPSVPEVYPEDIVPRFGMSRGEIFNHDRYLEGKESVLRYLRGRGFPLPEIEGEAVYSEVDNDVTVHLNVKPGTAAKLGFVSFQGLHLILEEDLQRRLPFKAGMPYDPTAFEQARNDLERLDVFASIETEIIPRKEDPSTIDVIYKVREKPLKTLMVGVGAGLDNSRQESMLRAEWSDRNFYKRLRTFSVIGEPRYAVLPSIFRPEQHGPLGMVEVSFTHPYFYSPKNTLRTAVGFDADLEQAFRWYGPRFDTHVERALTNKLFLSGGYFFRYVTFYDVRVGFRSESRLVPPELFGAGSYRLGFVDQALIWDDRNNRFEPTHGFYASLRLAESGPFLGSSFTYLRFSPEVRKYIPLSSRASLAARAVYGQLVPLQSRASPITERFYGGGADHHRGFTYHRLAPQVNTGDARPVPVGGNVMVLFSLEDRFKITQLGSQWLVGAIFVDAGDVVESPQYFDLRRLHYAIGPGLRYQTPVGAIRADVGFRLNRLSENTAGLANPDPGDRFAIHLSFGEAF